MGGSTGEQAAVVVSDTDNLVPGLALGFKLSLDADSEEKVQNAIINLTKNKTTLVIAHRLSTIIRADKIILINRGEISDFGTHGELLKSSMIYKNLYSKQLSA